MNARGVAAVMRRDLSVAMRTSSVSVPLLLVPFLLLVVLPAIVGIAGSVAASVDVPMVDGALADLLTRLPADVASTLPGESAGTRAAAATLLYLMAPLYLVVPLVVALVLAADSIAGERERGTLESLLLSPLTDREILAAKLLGAWLPAAVVGVGGAVLYGAVVDVTLGVAVGQAIFPNVPWVLLAFWVGPALSAAALTVGVIVSARARTAQGAQQIGSIFVLSLVVLFAGQATGLLLLSPITLAVLGALLWSIAVLLVAGGSTWLRRGRLAERLG